MKKYALIFFFLLLGHSAFSQNVLSLFVKANEFFTLFEEDKFDTAHKYFDEVEQTKVTPDNLKQLWTRIKLNLGNVNSLEVVQSKTQGNFFVVVVEGKFEKGDQNFSLVFNQSEKLVGLFLPPKAVSYNKPSYADTALYTEKTIDLKTGSHQLAAVVTVPKNVKNFPIVVLVHGSGPGDMDQTLGPNKPFKDIALGLASQGVATLRYVKRTLIYSGEFKNAFTVKEEVLDDAVAAVNLAKTIPDADLSNVYLFGHSLGGMLAPRLANLATGLKGIVLAAAPARKLTDIIVDQNNYLFGLANDTTQKGKEMFQNVLLEVEQTRISKLGTLKPDSVILGLPASYWSDLNLYDQLSTAKKLKQRIFVVQGGKDFQVSETDYNLWNTTLAKKSNVTLKFYPDLNHLLSTQTEKGTNQQYQQAANVAEELINDLAAWIKLK
jgi:dienelactone hydrolase